MSRKAQERRAGSSQTLPGSHSRAAKRGAPWRCRGAVVWVVVEMGGRPWSLVPRVKRWLWRRTNTDKIISLHTKPTISLTKTRRVISLHTKPTIRLTKTRRVISLHTKPTIRFYQNTESYLSPHQAHTTPLPSASPHSLSVTSTLEGGNVHFMHRARQGWYRTTQQQRLTSGKPACVFNCTSTVTLEHVDYDHIGAFSEVHAPLPGVAAHDTSPVHGATHSKDHSLTGKYQQIQASWRDSL